MQGPESETSLIQRSLKGDREAFIELVDRHQKTLVNFLRSLSVSLDEIDDLSQEVWIKIYDYRSRYEEKAKFTTFLYKVAKMKVIDLHRKKTRWKNFFHLFQQSKQEASNQYEREALSSSTKNKSADELLLQLDADAREVVVLRFEEEMSYQEISEHIGLPLGTVKSRLHSAMKKLKEFA